MSKLIDGVKRAGGAVGAASAVYELAVKVEGAPVRERTEPAAIRIFGIPVFKRDEQLDRVWFGFIKRGKSRAAKAHLAVTSGDPDVTLPKQPGD